MSRQGRLLDPEDVLAGRARFTVDDLIGLIRAVNPTGQGLPAAEAASRYGLKTRLQPGAGCPRGFHSLERRRVSRG